MFFRGPGERRSGTAFQSEWERSGYADELWAYVQEWEKDGEHVPRWLHPEPGTSFDAFGPPGSTTRVYFATHAGQKVLLHVRRGKRGRGKLEAQTKGLVEQRLRDWKEWFPHGAELDEEGRLRKGRSPLGRRS